MKPNCPCNSQQPYEHCCQPYIIGKEIPRTAEALMRSRYTAYTLANISYIQKTMRGKAAEHYDPVSSKEWAESVSWQSLTVIDSTTKQVTFLAKFNYHDKPQAIYERSLFEKVDGYWFYIDGIKPKVKRNDPCPCQSGKKAKRCCFP